MQIRNERAQTNVQAVATSHYLHANSRPFGCVASATPQKQQ